MKIQDKSMNHSIFKLAENLEISEYNHSFDFDAG